MSWMGPLSLATSLSCRPRALSRTSSTIILITPFEYYPVLSVEHARSRRGEEADEKEDEGGSPLRRPLYLLRIRFPRYETGAWRGVGVLPTGKRR